MMALSLLLFSLSLIVDFPSCAAATKDEDSNEMTLELLPATIPSTSGGRCADGTMSGFYHRQGSDPNLFVIFLQGGGACYDEITCKKRANSPLGSSKKWAPTRVGGDLLDVDCSINPSFCNATTVYIPYCTGDVHGGNNTSPSSLSWGLYFDGHANFARIVETLIAKYKLNSSPHVLLTGDSAGGVGTFKNIDYLQRQLPKSTVKGAPNAGWFFPAALPEDLPHVVPPSDWSHFYNGSHGNQETADGGKINDFVHGELWQDRGLYPPACVAAQKPDQWWACSSVDELYKYIKSPLYVIESQYDTNQIQSQEGAPSKTSSPHEANLLKDYVIMYGQAMRNSTAQVVEDAPLYKAKGVDGIFHTSCFKHGVSTYVHLQNYSWMDIVGDWYFGTGALSRFYRMVETCPPSDGGLPCNPNPSCPFKDGPGPGPAPGNGCEAALRQVGCLANGSTTIACEICAEAHRHALAQKGCGVHEVEQLCSHK